jgi:predicted small integral membrane protein
MKENKKISKQTQESEVLVQQLNRDVRDSVLVVSLLVNAYILIGWLVIQVSNSYDAALINYLQNK